MAKSPIPCYSTLAILAERILRALLQWTPPRRSMKERDVELVCDNESQRNQWPLAVVTKVFPSSD